MCTTSCGWATLSDQEREGINRGPQARDLRQPDLLSRMMGSAGDGLHDRPMEFSRAVSGAHFFAPSLATLRTLARSAISTRSPRR